MTNDRFLPYLHELRKRLIAITLSFLLLFAVAWHFSESIYPVIVSPLVENLPFGSAVITTTVTTPFLAPLTLCLRLSFLATLPIFFYHAWRFVVPALYKHEKKIVFPLLLASIVLFVFGLLFAFYGLVPIAMPFFIHAAPDGVQVMMELSAYLDFIFTLMLACGLAFQCPLLTLAVVKFNLLSANKLRKKRPYIIVMAFTVAMLLTPPDVISQILLALPICLLFELGLLAARLLPSSATLP